MMSDYVQELSDYLAIDKDVILDMMAEAPYADFDYPTGSGSINERRILYALTRIYQPIKVLECGTLFGAGAAQFASAMKDGEIDGTVWTVDIHTKIHGTSGRVGSRIPGELLDWIEFVNDDAVDYLRSGRRKYNLIYEDTDHTAETTAAIWVHGLNRLTVGGLMISHDATHPRVCAGVMEGIKAAGVEPLVITPDGGQCGFAVYQKRSSQLG